MKSQRDKLKQTSKNGGAEISCQNESVASTRRDGKERNNRKKNNHYFMMLMILLLCPVKACSTAYEPSGLTGGYSVFPQDKYNYKITINANSFTTINQAEQMALFKASEITLKAGYDRFIITQNSLTNKQASSLSDYLKPLSAITPGGSRPSGHVNIKLLPGTEKDYDLGLDARKIYIQLKKKVKQEGPRF